MSLRLSRPFRRVVAWAVLALYALPSATALAAEVVHGVQHAAVAASQARRQATALGLVHAGAHLEAHAPAGPEAPHTPSGTPLVHTHDGSTHAHGPWVAALDRAADADGSSGESAPADGPTLSPHLATARVASAEPAIRAASASPPGVHASAAVGGPASPPPRG